MACKLNTSIMNLGLFDCLNNDFLITDRDWKGIRSKWCEIREVNSTDTADACFPKDCGADIITNWFWTSRSSSENISLHCSDDVYMEWTAIAVLTFTFILVLCLLPIISTIYFKFTGDKKTNPPMEIAILQSFDLRRSFAELCSVRGGASSTTFLDAFRVFSMLWVILGHSYQFLVREYTNRSYALSHIASRYDVVTNNTAYVLAVNTFFWIGGYLGASSMFRRLTSDSAPRNKPTLGKMVAKGYFMRYLRTVPMLVVCILLAWIVLPRFGSGLRWNKYFENLSDGYDCERYWWRDLLFINTYVIGFCLGWGWYVTTDFHFALILPLLVIPIVYLGDKIGVTINLVLIAATLVMVIFIESYIKANSRAIPFIMGVLVAWYTNKTRAVVKGSPVASTELLPTSTTQTPQPTTVIEQPKYSLGNSNIRCGCYITSAVIMCGVLVDFQDLARPDQSGDPISESRLRVHNVLREFFWSLGLSFLGIPYIAGYGGVVKEALSHPFWCILGKLTFGAYLIHPIIIVVAECLSPVLVYSKSMSYILWLGFSVSSYAASFVLWHIVESPISSVITIISNNIKFKVGAGIAAGLFTFLVVYGAVVSPHIGDPNPMKVRIYTRP